MCCRSAASSPPAPSARRAPSSRRRRGRRSTTCCRAWHASIAALICSRSPAPQASCPMTEIVTPRPASTILLLRDAVTRPEIEIFMMVRHYEIDFSSGALVFPGGSVDKGDKEIIADPALYSGGEGLEAGELAFRIAAIRETVEESGILLARPKGSKALRDANGAGEIDAGQ